MRKFDYFTRYMKMAPADDGGGGASAAPVSPGGGDGGASVSPSSPVDGATASPTPSTPDSGADGAPWANLGSSDDLDFLEISAQPAPVVAAPEVPVAPALVATPPAPVAPVPPTQPPSVPAQPQPQAQAPGVELSPSDPNAVAEAMNASRNEVIAHLAQSRFALTPEDVLELESDAAAFVPKMMARVMFEAQVSMQKFLAQAVPGMISKHQNVSSENTKAETQFFDVNKKLGLDINNAEHKKAAARMASVYRQANPDVPFEQLISDVGLMVATRLQLAAAPASAAQPPRGAGGFRPAVNGGGGASPAAQPADEWSGFGQTYDD